MKTQEFEIITASFVPSSVETNISDEEAIYDIEGEIEIPEAPGFFSTIQSPIGDLHIAFFAEMITIFGILTLNISAEINNEVGIVSSPYCIHVPKEEMILSFRGKMLKAYLPSDCIFGRGTGLSGIDSFFFRSKKTSCAIFKGWEKEFTSLDELIQFLSGYMLIS